MTKQWKKIKLGDIGKISMCKRILKKQTSVDGDIPFFKIGTFGKDEDAYIPKELYEEYKNKYSFPRKGEILISASGTIGRTVVYDGKPAYFQDSNIIWVSNDEKLVINRFLNYLYEIVTWQTASGTIARLYNDNVRQIQIVVPPLPEQHRIVTVLETWDNAIDLLKKKIVLKKKVKKGLMQRLLSGEVRLPGFSGEWKSMKLKKLGDTYAGLSGKTKEDFGKGKPFISYMNIYSNSSLLLDSLPLVDVGENERQFTAKYGDLFFTTSSETPNEVGISSVLLEKIHEPLYLNSFCFAFRLNNFDTILPDFAKFYFRGQKFRKQMTRIAQGASRYNLSKKYFMDTKITIPSTEEQQAITSILTTDEKEITLLEQKLHALEEQKKFLLNNLVTGEIRTPEDLLQEKV